MQSIYLSKAEASRSPSVGPHWTRRRRRNAIEGGGALFSPSYAVCVKDSQIRIEKGFFSPQSVSCSISFFILLRTFPGGVYTMSRNLCGDVTSHFMIFSSWGKGCWKVSALKTMALTQTTLSLRCEEVQRCLSVCCLSNCIFLARLATSSFDIS